MAKPRLILKLIYSFILLAFAMSFFTSSLALSAIYEDSSKLDRMHFSKKVTVKKVGDGSSLAVSQAYSYQVLEYGHSNHKLRLFDESGKEIEGVYEISSEVFQDLLRTQIQMAIEKAPEGVSSQKPGCCEVDGKKEEPAPKKKPVKLEVTTTKQEKKVEPAAPAPQPIPEPKSTTFEAPIPESEPVSLLEDDSKDEAPTQVASDEEEISEQTIDSEEPMSEPSEEEVLAAAPSAGLCGLYKKFSKAGVPRDALKQALSFYAANQSKFSNKKYVSIADYSQSSTKKRFYLLDMTTGAVTVEKVSHGGGDDGKKNGIDQGDPNHDGMLDRCRQPKIFDSDKNMTRVGFFQATDYYYSSKHGGGKKKVRKNGKWVWVQTKAKWPQLTKNANGLKLKGLSPTNKNAFNDGVVMHEAYYNRGGSAIMGRSYGCPAFVPGKGAPIMAKIRGGSMYYSYAPVCANDMKKVLKQVPGWQTFCADRSPSLEKPKASPAKPKAAPRKPTKKPVKKK